MRLPKSTGAAGSVAVACLVLLAGSLVRAQDRDREQWFRHLAVPQSIQVQVDSNVATAIPVSDHWIGVLCGPAGAVVKAQLKLDHGLAVERVVPDSPAAKAGLEQNDILLSFGDKQLVDVIDLVEAVKAAKDQPLELTFLHDGKQKTLKITPTKRPEDDGELRRAVTAQEAIKKWMEQSAAEATDDMPFRLRRFRPGVLVPDALKKSLDVPDNVTITITKQGNEKATITVKRDGKEFTATEEKLDDLPDDIRPHVAQMLGRSVAIELDIEELGRIPDDIAKQWPHLKKHWQPALPPQIRVYPGKPNPQALQAERRMRDQLEQMRRSLDQLQKQLDQIHGQSPDKERLKGDE